MIVTVRASVESDIAAIVSDIRPADEAEMAALGTTPEDAMRVGMQRSDWTMTGLLDGVPVCMFGVSPQCVLLGRGTPWMLASNALERFQVKFLRSCRPVIARMRQTYPSLANVVHSENVVAIRWLRWLGFSFHSDDEGDPVPFEFDGHVFYVFTMR